MRGLPRGANGGPDGGQMGGPMGAPPGEGALPPLWWRAALGIGCAIRLWRARRTTTLADSAFPIAMILTAAALTFPWLAREYLSRLTLMAPIPLAFALAYLLATSTKSSKIGTAVSMICSIGITVAVVTPTTAMINTQSMVMIDDASYQDLRKWRVELGTNRHSIVAAHHGLEFWAGFALATHSTQKSFTPEQFAKYDRFFVLTQRRGMRGGPPGQRRDGPGGLGGPGGQAGNGRRGEPDRPRGPMGGIEIPENARIVRESQRFTLFEVPKD